MSNNKGFEISVKQYAEEKNKTVQAVYQQMKRPGNAVALEGHIFTKRVGNKDVKYLDEEAVRILDEGRAAAPVIVQQDEFKAKYEEASSMLDAAKNHAAFQDGKIEMLKEMLAEKEQELRRLAEPQAQIDSLKRENGDLSRDLGNERAEHQKTKNEAQRLSDELTEARKQIEALENRTFGDYLKGLFRKK